MSRQKLRQINRARKAQAEQTRNEVLRKMSKGLPVGEVASGMGLSKRTIYRHLLEAQKAAPAITEEVRDELDQKLRALMEFMLQSEEATDKEIADVVRGCIQDLARLRGANAESKSFHVHANVDAENLVGYRRFIAETRGLVSDQVEQVYMFARGIERRKTIAAGPPENSELWEEEQK